MRNRKGRLPSIEAHLCGHRYIIEAAFAVIEQG